MGLAVGPATAEELLARVADGDRLAFGELYDRAAAPVYGLALRLLGDPEQAEQAALRAFVKVWREAPRFRSQGGTALGWILGMTHGQVATRSWPGARPTRSRRSVRFLD